MAKRWKYALCKDRYLRYLYRWRGLTVEVRNQLWVRWFPSARGKLGLEMLLDQKVARVISARLARRELLRGERARERNET